MEKQKAIEQSAKTWWENELSNHDRMKLTRRFPDRTVLEMWRYEKSEIAEAKTEPTTRESESVEERDLLKSIPSELAEKAYNESLKIKRFGGWEAYERNLFMLGYSVAAQSQQSEAINELKNLKG